MPVQETPVDLGSNPSRLISKAKMEKDKSEILTKDVYSRQVKREWKRLVKDSFHNLEFQTTLYFLKKYLQKKGSILDAGGGPGRYAIELAKSGYNVTLLDLVKNNTDFAKKKIKLAKVQNNIKGVFNGSVTDLSVFPDECFDSVICLGGPLSHISEEGKRIKGVSELVRVSKKNSFIFISVMSKIGTLSQAPTKWSKEIKVKQYFQRFISLGEDYKWHGKYYCHFFTLEEMKSLLSKFKNVEILEAVGLEGLGSASPEGINKLSQDRKAWKNWINAHYMLCTHPSVVDMSLHMLLICRKT